MKFLFKNKIFDTIKMEQTQNVSVKPTNVSYGFTKQEPMFVKADELDHTFYFSVITGTYIDKKGDTHESRLFGSALNRDEFLDWYEKMPPSERHVNELLREGYSFHEYYDLDCYLTGPKVKEEHREHIPNLSPEKLFNSFIYMYDMYLSNKKISTDYKDHLSGWRITDSSNENKLSLHLVNKNVIFKNYEELSDWYSDFRKFINNRVESGIFTTYRTISSPDWNVCTKNRCMRFIYSSKYGQNRPLLPATWHTSSVEAPISDFFIQVENPVFTPIFVAPKISTKESSLTTIDLSINKKQIIDAFDKLDTNRFKNYEQWRETIWLLCHLLIGENEKTIEIVNEIHRFSKKGGDTYCESSTDRLINSYQFEKCNASIGSLLFWLKEDTNNIYRNIYGNNMIHKAEMKAKEEYDEIVSSFIFDNDQRLMFKEDIGLSEIYYKYYAKENVKTVSDKGDAYVWDNKLRIWVDTSPSYLENDMMVFLENFIGNKWADIRQKYHDDGIEMNGALNKAFNTLMKSICKKKNIKGVLQVLCSKTKDHNFLEVKNRAKNLLPISGGKVLDLKTSTVREREKADNFTFEMDVNYIPKDQRNSFEAIEGFNFSNKFFYDLANGDTDLQRYLKQFLGYCLTGETRERSLFVFYGNGMNGKSLLSNFMEKLLLKKQFYTACSEDVLLETGKRNRGGATPELVALQSARLAVLNETGKREKLNEVRIKALTGGDTITCRDLYQTGRDMIEFIPQCKYLMLTNNKPTFDADSRAMLDRLQLIPFSNRFSKDETFDDKVMITYKNHIFSYIVDGACEWYTIGKLHSTVSMKEAMNEWIQDVDIVHQFVSSECEKGTTLRVKPKDLYDAFTTFLNENGMRDKMMRKTEFLEKMRRTYNEVKSHGEIYFEGLRLSSTIVGSTSYTMPEM